jgi:hypothetical protein
MSVEIKPTTQLVITPAEIAEITGWTVATVMKKAREGHIPFVPLSGKRGVFLRESFLYWLKNQETNLG